MNNEVLIKAENVSKKFCKDLNLGLYYGLQDLGSSFFGSEKQRDLRKKEFWAVDNISFEVRRGECLGLLGHNGAGKSTLLKVLTGLIAPDRGQITMKGRVNALIELTAGFNPILTGRENIYNNGAVLGLTEKEIDEKYDEIVAFSELEEFIDTPVQYYSSGMKVRLGFSVAVFTEPDVLILDEVLAVGDAGFRIKSYNKMKEVMKSAAVIFVTHSMPEISRTCDQVLFMRHGQAFYHGNEVYKGIELYFNEFAGNIGTVENTSGGTIENFWINGEKITDRNESVMVKYGSPLQIEFNLNITSDKIDKYFCVMRIADKDLKFVGAVHSGKFSHPFYVDIENKIKIEIPKINLIDGDYTISIMVLEKEEKDESLNKFICSYRDYFKFKMHGLNMSDYTAVYFDADIYQNNIKLNKKILI
ncbi:ABC transporter ATP-binding protein [Empedobacter tilapiae]